MAKILIYIVVLITTVNSQVYNTISPDKNIKISFRLDEKGTAQYSVSSLNDDIDIIEWSDLGLNFKGSGLLVNNLKVIFVKRAEIDETYRIISGKSKYARDFCNETEFLLEENKPQGRKLEIIFRAYNDGAAFRYSIPEQIKITDFTISSEETKFNFSGDYKCWAMKKNSFKHSYEGDYRQYRMSTLGYKTKNEGYLVTIPVTLEINPDLYVCLSEASIDNYPGMYLTEDTLNTNKYIFKSTLSPFPDSTNIYAIGKTPFKTPWRFLIIGKKPGDLIESQMVTNLNEPCLTNNLNWIKPGKSLWSWWANDRGFENDFGYNIISTNTIKYHIDFAAKNGIEYYTIDGGWYGWFNENKLYDVTQPLPECDLSYLASYANSKNVGLFVWAIWSDIDRQMEKALDYLKQIGIKGIKVDFMDRDDQHMVNFYKKITQECFKRKLLVNFHGGFKPDGSDRTYPNVITREAVLGNEYAKWDSALPNPNYNVTIPFTRMVVGPMDYTVGSMVNVSKTNFTPVERYPMTMGTRVQQLAMLVVYQSGLITLCESPKIYENLPEFDFIKQVPATWDSTIVLDGKIGEYLVIARKKGNDWFIGGITNWNSRNIELKFDFLEEGNYQCTIYSDANDADKNPQNTDIIHLNVNRESVKNIKLAKGGGLALILKPMD